MTDQPAEPEAVRTIGRGGMRRDETRDADILDATLEVLGEIGYERMTMNAVASRARAGKATVYRRWESKQELVLDALRRMGQTGSPGAKSPDTGSLAEDLRATFQPYSLEEEQRKLSVARGIQSLASERHDLAEVVDAVCIQPWAAVFREQLDRAVARGEMTNDPDIAFLSRLIPSMAAYRAIVEGKSVDAVFLLELVDKMLLPAAGITLPAAVSADPSGTRKTWP